MRPTGGDVAKIAGAFALASVLAIGGQKAYRAQLLEGTPEIPKLTAAVATSDLGEDPEGEAPVRSWEVTTEDGNTATLSTSPSDAWKGSRDAKVVIVEFADFECGYCKRASGQLKQVVQAFGDDVMMVYKHYPMDPKYNPGVKNTKHRNACNAAIASVCAQRQGKFWAFHDLAFKNQHQLKLEHIESYVTKVGMDMDAFKACVRQPDVHAQVRANGEEGKAVDVHGTPRVFINGKLYKGGMSAQQYARLVQAALGMSAEEGNQRMAGIQSKQLARKPLPAEVRRCASCRTAR